MIWESSYWKNDLLKLTTKIRGRMKQTKWVEASNANAEKDIMIAGFIARKLFDSNKISPKLENHELKIVKYPSNGQRIHLLRRLSPDRFFDFENPVVSTIKFRTLCNQIIHSYIFMLIMDNHGHLMGFWVASDFDKFKFMYFIDLKAFCFHLLKIAKYWPREEVYQYDPAKNDYTVNRK